MTLTEVVVALGCLAVVYMAIMPMMIQSRRLTEGTVAKMKAATIAQAYMEQMRGMTMNVGGSQNNQNDLINGDAGDGVILQTSHVPINFLVSNSSGALVTDTLTTTPANVDIPTLIAGLPAGTTPTGVYDNIKDINPIQSSLGTVTMQNSSAFIQSLQGAATTWGAIWPNANTTQMAYPTALPYINDLHINFRVQIVCLTSNYAGSNTKQPAYGIHLYYTWQVGTGSRRQYFMDHITSIRAAGVVSDEYN